MQDRRRLRPGLAGAVEIIECLSTRFPFPRPTNCTRGDTERARSIDVDVAHREPDAPEPRYLAALVQRVSRPRKRPAWQTGRTGGVDRKRNASGDVVVAVIVKASAKG